MNHRYSKAILLNVLFSLVSFFCIIKKKKKKIFLPLLFSPTFSKGEESGYYYYYSFPVSCWLSGPFFHWLIVRKRTHRQTFFFLLLSSCQTMNMEKEKKIFLFLFSSAFVLFNLEEADDWGQFDNTTTMFILQMDFNLWVASRLVQYTVLR